MIVLACADEDKSPSAITTPNPCRRLASVSPRARGGNVPGRGPRLIRGGVPSRVGTVPSHPLSAEQPWLASARTARRAPAPPEEPSRDGSVQGAHPNMSPHFQNVCRPHQHAPGGLCSLWLRPNSRPAGILVMSVVIKAPPLSSSLSSWTSAVRVRSHRDACSRLLLVRASTQEYS